MSVPMCRFVPLLLHSLGTVVLLRDQVHLIRYVQRAADLRRLLRRPVRANSSPCPDAAVLLGRARPSVCPSVCPVRAPNSKIEKNVQKSKLAWTFSRTRVSEVPVFG